MVKLRDIAEKSGFTVSTVSRALRKGNDLSENTVRQIKATAEELGYFRALQSRGVAKTVGVVLPEVRSNYYAELAHSLAHEIRKYGFRMLFVISDLESKDIREMYDYFCSLGVDGIILTELIPSDPPIGLHIAESGIPAVLLSDYDDRQPVDKVYVDSHTCMQLAVDHLWQLGHRAFGYVGEHNSAVRYQAMCDILRQKGSVFDEKHVKIGTERFELGGYLRMRELLKENSLPTAIIASYDQIAFGAMRAAREAHLSVPKDFSIVGVDNVVMGDYMPVGLTSITNPSEQLGVIAVKLLMGHINNRSGHVVQNVALQSKLVIRASTGPPAAR